MFGIGLPELAVIAMVAVLVFGPDRMPDLARQAARMLHRLKQFAQRAQRDVRAELGPEYADFKLRDLDPRQMIRRQVMEALEEIESEEDERRMAARFEPRPFTAEKPPFDSEAT